MVNEEMDTEKYIRKPIRKPQESFQQHSEDLKDDSSHVSESEQQTLYPEIEKTPDSMEKEIGMNVSKRRHKKPSPNPLYPGIEKIPESVEMESLMNVSKRQPSVDVRVYISSVYVYVKSIRNRRTHLRMAANKVLSHYYLFSFCAVLFLIFAISSGVKKYWASEERSPENRGQKTGHDLDVSDLLAKYGGQNPLSNRILKVALKFVNATQEPPSNPAIVTVLASPGLVSSAKSFCIEVSRYFTPNYVLIDQEIYGSGDDNEIKVKIEYAIESIIVEDKLGAVIVDQVEKIPLNATMIFHSYCDEAYPRHQRMIYFFILTLNEDVGPEAGPEEVDSAAMRMFREGWKHVHPDVYSSLITRLTGYVLNFRSLETKKMERY